MDIDISGISDNSIHTNIPLVTIIGHAKLVPSLTIHESNPTHLTRCPVICAALPLLTFFSKTLDKCIICGSGKKILRKALAA